MRKQNGQLKNFILSAVLLAMGIVLPLFAMQVKEIGDTLLPMHLPVMLCGLVCGWPYGLLVGTLLPFLRSVCFGMPPLYPNAVWMAAELAAYGFVIGLIYHHLGRRTLRSVYISLLAAMFSGRIVWGIAKGFLLGLGGKTFTFYMFLLGGFVDAIPGIILQLVLIPAVMSIVHKKGVTQK